MIDRDLSPNSLSQRGLTDTERLDNAVLLARHRRQPIPDSAARVAAALIHNGQASALYALASSGFIDRDGLEAELQADINDPNAPPEVREWGAALLDYVAGRESTEAVDDWHKLWLDQAAGGMDDDDCCVACGEHISAPHAPGCSVDPEYQEGSTIYEHGFIGLTQGEQLRVVQLLERRGQPARVLLDVLGTQAVDDIARNFDSYYQGEFDSFSHYVEAYLSDSDVLQGLLRFVPEWIKDYVKIDIELLARDMLTDGNLYVEELDNGHVYVFTLA